MDIRRKWFAAVLVLVLIFSIALPVSADEKEDADKCIQQMLNYYRYYGDTAATDIACLNYQLSQINPYKAQDWASIMDYWSHVNSDLTLYPKVLPDGLPQDDSLCIVVLGYALASDGSMRKELIGRLETAYASAQKYPNAYIVCTGGGTAQDDKTVTEAGKMSQWLIEKGIDKDRVIVEDRAMSTVGNALNTCKILAEDYPRVTHLALVTSDYHLPRSCLLFHAQATLSASKGAPLLCVAANASYTTGRAAESLEIQAGNLSQLVNVPINGMPKPDRSKLDHILVSGGTQFIIGTEPDLQTIAYYSTGFCRDVSNDVKYAGVDLAAAGVQEVTVTYEESGKTVSATAQIELLLPETEPPTTPPTVPPTAAPTEAPTQPETEAPTQPSTVPSTPPEDGASDGWWLFPTVAALLFILAVILITKRTLRIRKRRKAAKAIAEEDDVNLPADDSPLEYI